MDTTTERELAVQRAKDNKDIYYAELLRKVLEEATAVNEINAYQASVIYRAVADAARWFLG